MIYCVTEEGEDHLVCGVAIDGKTYILENRYDDPKEAFKMLYKELKKTILIQLTRACKKASS